MSDTPLTSKQLIPCSRGGDMSIEDLDRLVDRLCHSHSPKPQEDDLYRAQVAILHLAKLLRATDEPTSARPFAWICDDNQNIRPHVTFREDRPDVPGHWFPVYRAAPPPPALLPAPDLSEHIEWMREHLKWMDSLKDHLQRAAVPPTPEYELVGYQYAFPSGGSSVTWRDNPELWNGFKCVGWREIFARRPAPTKGAAPSGHDDTNTDADRLVRARTAGEASASDGDSACPVVSTGAVHETGDGHAAS